MATDSAIHHEKISFSKALDAIKIEFCRHDLEAVLAGSASASSVNNWPNDQWHVVAANDPSNTFQCEWCKPVSAHAANW